MRRKCLGVRIRPKHWEPHWMYPNTVPVGPACLLKSPEGYCNQRIGPKGRDEPATPSGTSTGTLIQMKENQPPEVQKKADSSTSVNRLYTRLQKRWKPKRRLLSKESIELRNRDDYEKVQEAKTIPSSIDRQCKAEQKGSNRCTVIVFGR